MISDKGLGEKKISDRLLSNQEIGKTLEITGSVKYLRNCAWLANLEGCQQIAKAQLAKADADWVEWIEVHIVKDQNAIFKDCVVINSAEFQERKKEVGL